MKRFYTAICTVEKYIAMTGIVLMTVFIFLGAVTRTLGCPLGWTTDMGQFMLAWATFLAGDIAFREGRLANLDVVIVHAPVRIQKTIAVLIYAIIIAFILCMIYFGSMLTYTSRFRTFNGVQGFSYSWVTLAMPVSGCFMLITAVVRLIRILRSDDPKQISKM